MNLVALATFITAIIFFVMFHILPWREDDGFPGWKLWPEVVRLVAHPSSMDGVSFRAISGLVSGSLVLVSTPFLWVVMRRSRVLWWIVFATSSMATFGLSGTILYHIVHNLEPGKGMICVIVAQILLTTGLLFIRREDPPAPTPDHQ